VSIRSSTICRPHTRLQSRLWISSIRKEEALASANHSLIEIDKWEEAHLDEDEMRKQRQGCEGEIRGRVARQVLRFLRPRPQQVFGKNSLRASHQVDAQPSSARCSYVRPIFGIVSASDGEVSLDLAPTIMQGAPSCTFRCKIVEAPASAPASVFSTSLIQYDVPNTIASSLKL